VVAGAVDSDKGIVGAAAWMANRRSSIIDFYFFVK
jgi:hypothetical protein